MKNPFFLLSLLIITFYSNVFSKSDSTKLAKDYDYFCKIMQANPQLEVRKKVQNLHLLDSLQKYRKQAISCRNYNEFAFFMDQICNMFNDGHLYACAYQPDMTSKQKKRNDKYYKYIWRKKRSTIILGQMQRDNGKYYFCQSLVTQSKNHPDTIIYEGMELLSIDGITPQQFIKKSFCHFDNNKWDTDNKYFYRISFGSDLYSHKMHCRVSHNGIIKQINIEKRGLLDAFRTFRIIDGPNKQLIRTRFPRNYIIDGGSALIAKKPIIYLPQKKILYIRLPSMWMDSNVLPDDILKYKTQDIKKVVIDIRGNEGGSDLTWIAILKHIISEKLEYKISYAHIDSDLINSRIEKEFEGADIIDSKPYTDLPFLSKNKYKLIIEQETIEPSPNSIQFGGKIYILQNEHCYSAAGSLISMAERYKHIINIGVPTGELLGRGMTPMVFMLPNSGLGIQMHPVIDLSNVQQPEDVFHDKVEIPIKLTIEEILNYYKESIPVDQDFLLNHDPWMTKVFED